MSTSKNVLEGIKNLYISDLIINAGNLISFSCSVKELFIGEDLIKELEAKGLIDLGFFRAYGLKDLVNQESLEKKNIRITKRFTNDVFNESFERLVDTLNCLEAKIKGQDVLEVYRMTESAKLIGGVALQLLKSTRVFIGPGVGEVTSWREEDEDKSAIDSAIETLSATLKKIEDLKENEKEFDGKKIIEEKDFSCFSEGAFYKLSLARAAAELMVVSKQSTRMTKDRLNQAIDINERIIDTIAKKNKDLSDLTALVDMYVNAQLEYGLNPTGLLLKDIALSEECLLNKIKKVNRRSNDYAIINEANKLANGIEQLKVK